MGRPVLFTVVILGRPVLFALAYLLWSRHVLFAVVIMGRPKHTTSTVRGEPHI